MKTIGLISDTHNFLDDKFYSFFEDIDELWHAGDIGSLDFFEKLQKFKPLRAVYGNIDGAPIRIRTSKIIRFTIEETDILITHIGGYPGNYSPEIKPEIFKKPPKLFICGHSHILKIMNDKSLKLLHINPGAAGNSGFHKVKTGVKFKIDTGSFSDLEILEIKR